MGDKPLLVLTAGKNSDASVSDGLSARDFEPYQSTWINDLQIRLMRLSSRGKRILVPDSGHDIPSDGAARCGCECGALALRHDSPVVAASSYVLLR